MAQEEAEPRGITFPVRSSKAVGTISFLMMCLLVLNRNIPCVTSGMRAQCQRPAGRQSKFLSPGQQVQPGAEMWDFYFVCPP